MSSSPTAPAPAGTWFARNRMYIVAALGWLALAVQAVRTGQPIPVPTADQLPVPLQQGDAQPIDYEGCRFNGCDHDHDGPQQIQAQAARWPADRITYGIDYASARGMSPPLPDAAIQAAFRQATAWWGEQLQIDFVEVAFGDAPMIPINFARLDGPGGTLAQAYLADGTNRPKPLTMDVSERWTAGPPAQGQVSMPTVGCHEIGHSLGCGHDAANALAVMRPTYSASLPREQDRDITRMVALGYKRREKVPPAATDVLSVPVQIKTADVIDGLKKLGFTVTKP